MRKRLLQGVCMALAIAGVFGLIAAAGAERIRHVFVVVARENYGIAVRFYEKFSHFFLSSIACHSPAISFLTTSNERA